MTADPNRSTLPRPLPSQVVAPRLHLPSIRLSESWFAILLVLPAILGIEAWFGTLGECVDAAVTGRWRGHLRQHADLR